MENNKKDVVEIVMEQLERKLLLAKASSLRYQQIKYLKEALEILKELENED